MRSWMLSVLSLFVCVSEVGQAEESAPVEFELLMGKNTAHWQFVKQDSEVVFLKKCQKLYEKNIQLKDKESSVLKIPKAVHFVWLGPKAFPSKFVKNIKTWMSKNPDWTFVFWTDQERAAPCEGMQVRLVKDFSFSKLGKRYVQSDNWSEKANILRYEILLKEGGVYVDPSAHCLQSFEDLHKAYDLYCCLETPHSPFAGQNLTCGNEIIGCKPNHPTIEKVINLIDSRWDTIGIQPLGKDSFSKKELVMQRTYIVLTDVLKAASLIEGSSDIVLPSAYFFAKSGLKSLYSKNIYANAWADEGNADEVEWDKTIANSINKMKHSSKHFMLYLFALIAICLISVVMICVIFIKVKQRYFSEK